MKFYQNKYSLGASEFPISQAWGEGTLSIPLFPGMTDAEQNYVIDVLLNKIEPMIGDI
jgi:UDP-4-amino-4-deoxy-L-arabinose-oxoglutarate aminotransferase